MAAFRLSESTMSKLQKSTALGKRVVFSVVCESYGDIKEIFFRMNPKREYVSTGSNDYGGLVS